MSHFGTHLDTNIIHINEVVAAVENTNLPEEFTLDQNFPNPFNPTTKLRYGLPKDSDVRIIIYDINGRIVKSLVDNSQQAGWYNILWNGTNNLGQAVGSGMYIARMQAGSFTDVKKMLYLK